MALHFFIDNIEVEEPQGFIGITFDKVRHEKYYGWWGATGINVGNASGKVTFIEDRAVNYIRKQVAKQGTQLNIGFTVKDDCAKSGCNTINYLIDIENYEENCCEVSCTFKGANPDLLQNKMETKVEVIVNDAIAIPRINGNLANYNGVTLKDAITQILSKLGQNTVQLCSNWLDNEDNIWLTNGYNLRGEPKRLLLSLDDIFMGINPCENIEYNFEDGCFGVEKKGYNCDKLTRITGDFETNKRSLNSKWIYNDITIGFNDWKGVDSLSDDETNTKHYYSTGYNQGKNKLELISPFITSHYLIDKVIGGTDSTDQDKIFMVWKKGSRAELSSDYNNYYGTNNNNKINWHFTPARCLQRHMNYLYLSGEITFTGGEGNTKAYHKGQGFEVKEDMNISSYVGNKIQGLFNYEFETKFSLEQFCKLKKCVEFKFCDEVITGQIMNSSFKIDEVGSTLSIVCNSVN